MKHTQGKWTVRNSKNNDNIIVGVDDRDTLYGDKIFFKVATCTNEANANLIASAPEMLEVLYEIESVLHTAFLKDESSDIKEVWKKVLRLISKAEGGSK